MTGIQMGTWSFEDSTIDLAVHVAAFGLGRIEGVEPRKRHSNATHCAFRVI